MKISLVLASALALGALSLGQAAAAPHHMVRGKIVHYLPALGIQSVNAIQSQHGAGGISFNVHSARRAGVYTYGAMQPVQPLGVLVNGRLYLIVVPDNRGSQAAKLANHVAQWMTLSGMTMQRDGVSVFDVYSVL
ncbi:MAG: hypothetical protein ACREMP_02950 [Candidatus Tyrphobacter sp.]